MVRIGDELDFTIVVGNRGSRPAENVVMNDTLPSYLDILDVSASRGDVSVNGNAVTVGIGQVAPGEIVTIRIRTRVSARAPAPTVGYNTALITTSSAGEDPGNDRSTVVFVIVVPGLTPLPVPPELPRTGAPADRGGLLPPLALLSLALTLAGLALRRRARQ